MSVRLVILLIIKVSHSQTRELRVGSWCLWVQVLARIETGKRGIWSKNQRGGQDMENFSIGAGQTYKYSSML